MRAATAIVFLFLMSLPAAAGNPAASAAPAIKVDQAGYLPGLPKVALVAASQPATTFTIRRSDNQSQAFSGKLSDPVLDPDTGDRVQAADFSALRRPGTYYLDVPGVGRSWEFRVGDDVFDRVYYLAMRGFYGQRCGTAVDMAPDFPGYAHPACHTKGVFNVSSGKSGERANLGGWHDAGDYGRYLPTSGISTGTVLWAWEMFGAKLKDRRLNIPESGNGTPDILNEARWNLEWMLKMQDDDGGVWHKQTSVHFSGFVNPQDDDLPSEVIGTGASPFKSTCATADLAAVAAIAARTFAPFDRGFADRNREAARKAWQWTEQYPNVAFKNPAGVSTGEYGDKNCSDERLWAAAELWRTTGDAAYQRYFIANYASALPYVESTEPDSWAQLGPMALWTYAAAQRKEKDAGALAAIRKATVDAADQIVRRTNANPYHVSLRKKDYVWGSNGLAAQYGAQLLITNALAPNPAYVQAAADNLHYLLGRNTFSLSWVTRVGANPFRHPHHRPSGAHGGEPWPGLLSGGPNANRQDAVLQALPALPPAQVYRDEEASYASNEIAINWQAALVFLLAGQLH